MLNSLKPGMATPEVIRFPDGHFRRVIYGLSPYIADYLEQALLECIVQGWCPKYVLFMPTYLWLTSCQMYSSLQRPRLCLLCALLSGTYQTDTSIVYIRTAMGQVWTGWGHHCLSQVPSPVLRGLFIIYFKPFTNNFPHANINELLSPNLLHQLIKGTFKDHLVTWVNNYIKAEYPESEALKILDDIDRQ
jgi:Plavaka transposase